MEDNDVAPLASRTAGRRGQAALARLVTTDDFTRKLALDDRKVILFLLVALVDRHDSLTRTYNALKEAHRDREDHWTYGKDVAYLQRSCARFLGGGAARAPRWPEIEDFVTAGVSERNRGRILAFAAGLHCRAANVEKPAGYDGPIAFPSWVDAPRVSAKQIRDELIEVTTNGSDVLDLPVPRASSDPADLIAEVAALKAELRDREYQLRSAVVSLQRKEAEVSILGHRVRALTGEVDILRRADTVLRNEVRFLRRHSALRLMEAPTVRFRPVARPTDHGRSA